MDTLLRVEKEAMALGRSRVAELLTVRRNRNAMLASEIVMFMQQSVGSPACLPAPSTPPPSNPLPLTHT